MAAEIKRLNEHLATSQQSFYRLYQALLAQKKQTAQREQEARQALAEAAKAKQEAENKAGKALAEAETLRDELEKAKTTIETLKNEKNRLRENCLQAEAEVKRKIKDVELADTRREVLERENAQLSNII